MSFGAFDLTRAGVPVRSQIQEATVSTRKPAPSSHTDPLYVVPAWRTDGSVLWKIDRWPALHGATLPAQGAECWVIFSDARNMAVLWWDGTYS